MVRDAARRSTESRFRLHSGKVPSVRHDLHPIDSTSPPNIVALQRIVGNHALVKLVRPNMPHLQRLPSLADFQEQTDTGGERVKITAVDDRLSTYHSLKYDPVDQKLEAIGRLREACELYLNYGDKQAKRKTGVRALMQTISKEVPLLEKLGEIQKLGKVVAAVRPYIELQDRVLKELPYGSSGFFSTHLSEAISFVVNDLRKDHSDELDEIAGEDLTRLESLLDDEKLPSVTRKVLNELLALKDDIYLKDFHKSGSHITGAIDEEKADGKKYVSEQKAFSDEGLGTPARLGSLTHELTHISVGESYDNTIGFLVFNKDLTVEAIVKLGQKRVAQVKRLLELLRKSRSLTEKQKTLIKGKLDYAMESKLGTYASSFSLGVTQNKGTKYEEGYRKAAEKFTQVKNAFPMGNSVLIEYDSVVNQTLVYLHTWGVPETSNFYKEIKKVAQEAYEDRAKARN